MVSVDSMAVYRNMDIGTAKPTPPERAGLTVHMIDLVDASFDFTVSHFQSAARDVVRGIEERAGRALFVGGTGLYLRAVTDDLRLPGIWPDLAASLEREADTLGPETLHARLVKLDPEAAGRIEPANRRRVVRALEVTLGSGAPFSSYGPGLGTYADTAVTQVGIPYVPAIHDQKIRDRFELHLEQGLLDEVQGLLDAPGGMSRTARQAIGYKELISFLEGEVSFAVATESAVRRTRNLARRQWAWFRRDPRIDWVDPSGDLGGQLFERFDRARSAGTRSPVGD